MKANCAARKRMSARNDKAAAGIVAAVLMLGGIVAFLAYMNVAWVPRWVEGKESSYAATINTQMGDFADLAESQIARNQTSRSFSTTLIMGVRGIPFIGAGASSSELVVADGPTLNVSVGSLPVMTAGGSIAFSTHTQRYPNQTYRYTLGAMETTQEDGSWVDLRNLLTVSRTTTGRLSLAVQTVNITSTAQQTGGSGEATAIGVVTNISTTTDASAGSERVTILADNVKGGAWRAAMNRTFATGGLTGVYQDCSAAIAAGTHYCFPSGATNNTAERAEVVLLSVSSGWTRQSAKVVVTVTG